MTAKEFQAWRELQLTGIELLPAITATFVRLGVAIGELIQTGQADDSDYSYFETWHYAGKIEVFKAYPCWQNRA